MENVFITSSEALKEAIQSALNAALKEQLPSIVRKATSKKYLTKKELMALTGWSARQVEYKKSRREIPFIRQGRLVLFPTDELDAFFLKGYVPSQKK